MSNVHEEISKHSQKQHQLVKEFLELEARREYYIDEAVNLCKTGKIFSTDKINTVTKGINELAKNGIVPTRKLVTEEMVREYVDRLNQQEAKINQK